MTLVLRNIDFEVSGVKFSDPSPSGHGGQTIYVNYEKDGRLNKMCQLQTPWLYNPFGLNQSPEAAGETPKYYVELSMGNAPSAYVQSFHDKMKALDQHVIDSAKANSRSWLSRAAMDDEYVQTFYKPIVRQYHKKVKGDDGQVQKVASGDYPDTIRFKVPHYINEAEEGAEGGSTESFSDLQIYDAQKNRIPIANIEELKTALGRGNRVRAIAQCHSVWQTGKEFGVSWKVKRLQVLPSDGELGDECLIMPGSDDETVVGVMEDGGHNSDEESV